MLPEAMADPTTLPDNSWDVVVRFFQNFKFSTIKNVNFVVETRSKRVFMIKFVLFSGLQQRLPVPT